MLCQACQRHFDFSQLDYSSVKERTITILEEEGIEPSLTKSLEDDLEEYREALQLSKSHKRVDICPWYNGNLSALNLSDSLFEKLQYDNEIQVWGANLEEERPTADVHASASAGCEICMRLCAIIAEIVDYEIQGLESRLELEIINLMPRNLRLLLQGPVEHQYISMHILPWDLENGIIT